MRRAHRPTFTPMMAAMCESGLLYRWRRHDTPSTSVRAAADLARKLAIHPLVGSLLHQRGLSQPDAARAFLNPRLTDLIDPVELPGLDDAARMIVAAAAADRPLVIYGDYDVDGITASAILWHTLRAVNARVTCYVPHRIEEGYGLNVQAIRQLAADGRPLIVSVDCGITAVEPARAALDMGCDLIITDHHELPAGGLPEATVLVHPRLPGSTYPFGHLCGAGVAFKLAWHIARVHCGSERVPEAVRALLLDLLSLAALGTVADVVPLVGENRVITSHGLGHIKRTRFKGLNALIDAARLREEKIDAFHVGFVLGPRLNACGRMGHAREAIGLLTDADPVEAARIAQFLTQENDRRRATEREIVAEAEQLVRDSGYDGDDCRGIVLGQAGWHAGVIGIVAARLVDRYARPVVMLSIENGVAHGSARSVEGIAIHEAIASCADLLISHGGHRMAAGLRISAANIDAFRERFTDYVNRRLDPADMAHAIDICATGTLEDMTLPLIEQIQQLAPFGRGNPGPLLCLEAARMHAAALRVGGEGRHLRLPLRHGRHHANAIGFGLGHLAGHLPAGVDVDIAFEPKVSTWQGRRRPEIHVKDVKVLG